MPSEVVIGFTESEYSVAEDGGSVLLNISIISGTLGQSIGIQVDIELSDDSALGEFRNKNFFAHSIAMVPRKGLQGEKTLIPKSFYTWL